jgi:hypothetical protein
VYRFPPPADILRSLFHSLTLTADIRLSLFRRWFAMEPTLRPPHLNTTATLALSEFFFVSKNVLGYLLKNFQNCKNLCLVFRKKVSWDLLFRLTVPCHGEVDWEMFGNPKNCVNLVNSVFYSKDFLEEKNWASTEALGRRLGTIKVIRGLSPPDPDFDKFERRLEAGIIPGNRLRGVCRATAQGLML